MRNDDTAWQQRGLEALREMFSVSGQQRREMIEFLFDAGFWDRKKLSWSAAEARWNDCKNPDKPAFWKLTELWALMRQFGRHHVFLAMGEDLEYDLRRRPTEERLQALLERTAVQLERTEAELADCRAALARVTADADQASGLSSASNVARFRLDEKAGKAGLF